MKLTKRSLLAGIALGVFALATPALAEPVTLKVWSIDGANAPGIADVMSKEFDDANEDIVVEYRVVPFDDLVQESLRAFATGQAPDIVSFDNPMFASATDVFATYTTFDQTVTVSGVDIAMDFVANDNWTFSGTLSWVSEDVFEDVVSSNNVPLMLNAPTNKVTAGTAYRSTSGTWGVDAQVRHANAYPVNSGVYATGVDFPLPGAAGTYRYDDIDAATVVDVGFNWRFQPAANSLLFSIRADNLFDTKYRTMPGTPELGMMIVTRLQYSF